MQTIIRLNLTDIKKVISEYFGVDVRNVSVTGCGNDTGDGPYSGGGYYCYIEVEKDIKKINLVTQEQVKNW